MTSLMCLRTILRHLPLERQVLLLPAVGLQLAEQLVEGHEDLEWLATDEGTKVRCKPTSYTMPCRLLEVREYINGKRYQRALAQYSSAAARGSRPDTERM